MVNSKKEGGKSAGVEKTGDGGDAQTKNGVKPGSL